MSGELFVTAKLKAKSSAVSVFCCSGKLHMVIGNTVEV